ncbi:hypothetical protein GCM10009117_20420 [Gangjinia marincola]|uniref:OmpA-like domain-containing protein n=1 Tax=Gangjinia marincola TaxID=578463 RepID=A0ABP3XWS2_9FLAO
MKLKPTLVLLIGIFFFSVSAEAQFLKKLGKRVEQAAERTVLNKSEQKTSKETGKVFDKTVEGKGKKKKKKSNSSKNKDNAEPGESTTDDSIENEGPGFGVNKKFDFVPGEKLIAYEDFSQDEVGDLPAKWNSSNSAEVVTLNNQEGRWIEIGQGKGALVPEFINTFPDNFTLEFDVVFDYNVDTYAYVRNFVLGISDLSNPAYQMDRPDTGKNGFMFAINGGIGGGGSVKYAKYTTDKNLNLKGEKKIGQLNKDNRGRGEKMHISVWRQKQRLRVYVDDQKVFDVPRAFEKNTDINHLRFYANISPTDMYYYLGNVRYAVGKPDMRSKLITEGKLVTYGITFDSGSAQIKPASNGTLKEIASVLNENTSKNVTIIGHTDIDGSDASNLELSKKRAASVKEYLVENFGVSQKQLSTNGKGETDPLEKGTDPASKAKNRRVEFIVN